MALRPDQTRGYHDVGEQPDDEESDEDADGRDHRQHDGDRQGHQASVSTGDGKKAAPNRCHSSSRARAVQWLTLKLPMSASIATDATSQPASAALAEDAIDRHANAAVPNTIRPWC